MPNTPQRGRRLRPHRRMAIGKRSHQVRHGDLVAQRSQNSHQTRPQQRPGIGRVKQRQQIRYGRCFSLAAPVNGIDLGNLIGLIVTVPRRCPLRRPFSRFIGVAARLVARIRNAQPYGVFGYRRSNPMVGHDQLIAKLLRQMTRVAVGARPAGRVVRVGVYIGRDIGMTPGAEPHAARIGNQIGNARAAVIGVAAPAGEPGFAKALAAGELQERIGQLFGQPVWPVKVHCVDQKQFVIVLKIITGHVSRTQHRFLRMALGTVFHLQNRRHGVQPGQ